MASPAERSAVPQDAINQKRHLIGVSNMGRFAPHLPLSHVEADLRPEVSGREDVVVIPYAALNMDSAAEALKGHLVRFGAKSVRSLHSYPGDEERMLRDASMVVIGGGDTYNLSANVHAYRDAAGKLIDPRPGASQTPLSELLRGKAAEGVAIAGTSAGLIIMFADIRGSEDSTSAVIDTPQGRMVPVDGLELLPDHLQTLPHYYPRVEEMFSQEELERLLSLDPRMKFVFDQVHAMETNVGYIHAMDKSKIVIAMKDDAYIVVRGMEMLLKGETGAVIFEAGKERQEVQAGTNLSHLLTKSA